MKMNDGSELLACVTAHIANAPARHVGQRQFEAVVLSLHQTTQLHSWGMEGGGGNASIRVQNDP